MIDASSRMATSLCAMALILSMTIGLAGCGENSNGAIDKPSGNLAAGDHVTIVSTEGEFSLVETGDGKQVYVPNRVLVNTRESDSNKVYAITADTSVYEGAPPEKIPAPPAPRTARDISAARDQLPVLFLTESGREVYRSRQTAEPSLDPETREILWFALTCTNPDCPAKDQGQDGRPFLFIWVDPDWKVGMKIRNVDSESEKDRQRYESWVRLYTLPEAKGRAAELNTEHKRRIEVDKQPRQ